MLRACDECISVPRIESLSDCVTNSRSGCGNSPCRNSDYELSGAMDGHRRAVSSIRRSRGDDKAMKGPSVRRNARIRVRSSRCDHELRVAYVGASRVLAQLQQQPFIR